MKIKTPAQKILLRSLFYPEGKPAQFTVDKLQEAGSALKKIEQCAKPLKDNPRMIEFDDKEIEFTPAEVAILKPLFDEKEKWEVGQFEVVAQIKALFDGK